MNRLFFLSALIIPLVSGCQSLNYEVDFDAPHSKPAAGAIVQLNQTLTFQRGSSRSYIQHGLAQNFNGIDEREPWCQFYRYEPAAALKTMRTIGPDSFTITGSSQRMELVEIQPARPVVLLASTIFLPSMKDNDPNAVTLATIMQIKSAKQPEVVELKCAVFDDPYRYNYVSVNKIRQTLGQVVTLKLE